MSTTAVPRLALNRPNIPNLPGYRNNKRSARNLDHIFHYDSKSRAMLEVKPKTVAPVQDLSARERYQTTARSIGDHTPRTYAVTPRFVELDRKVLRFYAYFQEGVDESAVETYRVRKCVILFYLVDGSLQVLEPRSQNSGMPQGALIKRHQIPSSMREADFIQWQDLNVGEDIMIYGRTFRLVSCDGFTREFLSSKGVVPPADGEYPSDGFRSELTDPTRGTSPRAITKNGAQCFPKGNSPLKKYMEASLGRPQQDGGMLRQFLDYDRKVLRFFCVWDSRDRLFGDLKHYVLHYFLSDHTVEVREVHSANDGCAPFPALLARQPLPLEWDGGSQGRNTGVRVGENDNSVVQRADGEPLPGMYSFRDLRIGGLVDVYSRSLRLIDCDKYTRAFYRNEVGREQPSPIPLEADPAPAPRPTTAPYNGFGTEEDSRGSCISLMPKPPRKDFIKFMTNDRKLLRFRASLADARPEDKGRRFVITYYLADDTMQVYEPPSQNSGVMGGRFLQRGKYKNGRGTAYLSPADFRVGGEVRVNAFRFTLLEADDFSVRLMRDELGLCAEESKGK